MTTRKAKIHVVDKEGKIVETGTISTKSTAKTPEGLAIIPEFEKPILSVTINNPFRKLLYWINEIKKRQTTTLAFKLSVPLIALPVILAGVFTLGRFSGISFQKTQTPTTAPITPVQTESKIPITLSRAGTLRVAKGSTGTRYLLALRNGEIVNLQIPVTIDLTKYANKQVLVTGTQNKTTGVIIVTDIAEIQVYNATTVTPEATDSALK